MNAEDTSTDVRLGNCVWDAAKELQNLAKFRPLSNQMLAIRLQGSVFKGVENVLWQKGNCTHTEVLFYHERTPYRAIIQKLDQGQGQIDQRIVTSHDLKLSDKRAKPLIEAYREPPPIEWRCNPYRKAYLEAEQAKKNLSRDKDFQSVRQRMSQEKIKNNGKNLDNALEKQIVQPALKPYLKNHEKVDAVFTRACYSYKQSLSIAKNIITKKSNSSHVRQR